MAIQRECWPMFKTTRINKGWVRQFVLLVLAAMSTANVAFAQQSDDGFGGSFEDFMKGLGGRPPANAPERPPAGSSPGSAGSEFRQPPATGSERRDPTYSDPRYDTSTKQPESPFPARRNSEFDRTEQRPNNRSSRPQYQFELPEGLSSGSRFPAERNENEDTIPQRTYEEEQFDWKQQTTSIADLRFAKSTVFRHGDAWLDPDEETAYLDLLNAIARQRERLLEQVTRDNLSATRMKATWEEAYYQYGYARQLAWNNGHLRDGKTDVISSGILDPFRSPDAVEEKLVPTSDDLYSLNSDFAKFPEDFVGRPVVLMGMFKRTTTARIPNELTAEVPVSGRIPDKPVQLKVMRGTLTAIGSSRKIATVDTQNITFPESVTGGSSGMNDGPIPVLVKGWVVKNWDGRPLVYSETVRLLSPVPHHDLIRNSTIDKRRLQDDEKWIYYETLTQLEKTSAAKQRELATRVLGERIDGLMKEVSRKAAENLAAMKQQLKSGKISNTDFKAKETSLRRQVSHRIARYRKFRTQPDKFQTYVDVFQNPEQWHGKLLTLTGHVRHVVSYPSDDILFDGGKQLHELWLFTDDSQHNPAVIVTPNLPSDFPTDADVVDSVSVTGCFFKRYVYGSQDSARIAPLILAGTVQWQPTVDQVQRLVKEGELGAGSVRAQTAAAMKPDKFGETAMTLVCLFFVLVLMVLWGRAQREERDRVRLRKRVDEIPQFENANLLGNNGPDYTAGYTQYDFDSPIDDSRRTY